MAYKKYLSPLLPAIVVALLFIPWLGLMYFYSKGEPREAIVAVSMLDSGNWILPVSHGGDIPYKPPFLAWLIALCSVIFNGGDVNEFTSRLPSAIAAVSLLIATCVLLRKRVGSYKASVTMLVTATCFEFFRAGIACRVDMLLTLFMVGAVYLIYTMRNKPWRWIAAILFLSGATLTKGPVGSLLPCMAMGLYELLCGRNFLRTLGKMLLLVVLSWIIPALWYYAAYQQGGETFAYLAWEENIGRLTGTMGYESHVNPWYYNIVSLIAGALPWTVPVVLCMYSAKVRDVIRTQCRNIMNRDASFGKLAWIVGLTVLIFYCIPASKRSVYLLPCYPFIAYGIMTILVAAEKTRMIAIWKNILVVLAILAPVAFMIICLTDIVGLQTEIPAWWQWILAFSPTVFAIGMFGKRFSHHALTCCMALTVMLYIAYSGTFAPAIMNERSDAHKAEILHERIPAGDVIVTHINADSLLRYYSINFYMHDRLRLAGDTIPDGAWLLTDEKCEGAEMLTRRSADTRTPIYIVHNNHKEGEIESSVK